MLYSGIRLSSRQFRLLETHAKTANHNDNHVAIYCCKSFISKLIAESCHKSRERVSIFKHEILKKQLSLETFGSQSLCPEICLFEMA